MGTWQVSGELQPVGCSLLGEALSIVFIKNLHGLLEGGTLGLAGGNETSSEQIALGLGVPFERGTLGRSLHRDDDERDPSS